MPGISQWRKKRQTVRSHGVYVYHKRRMQVTIALSIVVVMNLVLLSSTSCFPRVSTELPLGSLSFKKKIGRVGMQIQS